MSRTAGRDNGRAEPSPSERDAILARLSRVEGQVRGVARMVEEERDCEAILTQLLAIRSAVERTASEVAGGFALECFRPEGAVGTEDAAERMTRVIRLLSRT